jgi:hypothetical protein
MGGPPGRQRPIETVLPTAEEARQTKHRNATYGTRRQVLNNASKKMQ